MIQNNAARSAPQAPDADGGRIAVQTRFGELIVDPSATVRLPRGLLGYSDVHEFALANLPEERFGQFKLLQSLERPELSFIVVPYNLAAGQIAREDIAGAYEALGIAPADGAVLLVVSVRKAGEAVSISVNLRAPILIDTANRRAWQHVLTNPAYSVRHVL